MATNKEMKIKMTSIVKHNQRWRVWEYKGKFYTSKKLAVDAYKKLNRKTRKV